MDIFDDDNGQKEVEDDVDINKGEDFTIIIA